MDWDRARRRAEVLEARHPEAAPVLRFARALWRFQEEIYRRARRGGRADARRLDTAFLGGFLPDYLQLVEKHGPPELAARAQKLQERPDWDELLRACWRRANDRLELLARAILEPYIHHLAERWREEVGDLGGGTGRCPFCGRPPLLATVNGERRLVCSLCATAWAFPEGECPLCRGRRLERLGDPAFPHLRVEGCADCGRYLKAVDLGRDPEAVAAADEFASGALDRAARERGFEKVERNLAGA
jgi:formate dehydrogenase maturation protein FdhE